MKVHNDTIMNVLYIYIYIYKYNFLEKEFPRGITYFPVLVKNILNVL